MYLRVCVFRVFRRHASSFLLRLPICSSFYHNSFSTSFTFLALASLSFLFYPSYFNSSFQLFLFYFRSLPLFFSFPCSFVFALFSSLFYFIYLFFFYFYFFIYIYIFTFFLNLYFVRPNLHLHTTKLSRVSKNTNKPFTFFF